MTAPSLREAATMAQLIGLSNFMAELVASNILELKDNDYAQDEAVDRLEWLRGYTESLTAALALPDAEPVGYRYKDSESMVRAMPGYKPGPGWSPLYAAPRPPAQVERKPLTDDEILAIGKAIGNRVDAYDDGIEFARAVIAADRGAA